MRRSGEIICTETVVSGQGTTKQAVRAETLPAWSSWSPRSPNARHLGHPANNYLQGFENINRGVATVCLCQGAREAAAVSVSFLRHGRSFHPMGQAETGSKRKRSLPVGSSVRMSRGRLFLSGLVSTRARLRFTGCDQYAASKGDAVGSRIASRCLTSRALALSRTNSL